MTTYTISTQSALCGVTALENSFISDYLTRASGDFVRVYIYALMQLQNPRLANDDIAAALGLTEDQVTEAFRYWQSQGLVRIAAADPMIVEFLPTRAKSTIHTASKYDKLLEALRDICGTRVFTATELKYVYDWLEIFGMSEEVVVKLVAYAMNLRSNSVSIKYMDAIARSWTDMHLYTAHDVDKYISEQNEYAGHIRDIKKRWRLNRNVTEDELNLYKKWTTEWQLSHEAIMDACSEVVSASNPSFAYLDRILDSYRERGMLAASEIETYRKKRMLSDELARSMFRKAGLKRAPTPAQRDKIETWLNDWRIPEDALLLLSEKAATASHPFEYMTRIATSWNERDIRNTDAARDDLTKPTAQTRPAGNISSPKANYSQRKYTTEDLIRLGVNLGGSDGNE